MSTTRRPRRGTLSAQEMRALRTSTGLSVRAWSALLDCSEDSVHNMETVRGPGKHLARLALLMAHPAVRTAWPEILAYSEGLLHKGADIP